MSVKPHEKMEKEDIKELIIIAIVSIVVIGFLIGFLNYLITSFTHKELSDLRFTTEYNENQVKIEVIDVIKEKGKETQYVIECFYGKTTIPESIYMEYIGENSNAVTITVAEAEIYIGQTYPFGIPTSFNVDIFGFDVMCVDYVHKFKFSWPWEEKLQPYTEEMVKKIAVSYLNGEIEANGLSSGLPEDAKEFSK